MQFTPNKPGCNTLICLGLSPRDPGDDTKIRLPKGTANIQTGEKLNPAWLIIYPVGEYNPYFRHRYFIFCTGMCSNAAAAVLPPVRRRAALR